LRRSPAIAAAWSAVRHSEWSVAPMLTPCDSIALSVRQSRSYAAYANKSPARGEEAICRMNSFCQTPLGTNKRANSNTAKPNAAQVGVSVLLFLTRFVTIGTNAIATQKARQPTKYWPRSCEQSPKTTQTMNNACSTRTQTASLRRHSEPERPRAFLKPLPTRPRIGPSDKNWRRGAALSLFVTRFLPFTV
jgi:hypothetical protein